MQNDTIKFYGYRPYPKPEFQNKFCWLPYRSVMIDSVGDVMLCNCQSNMPYVVGNIYSQSLKDIWQSTSAQQVRDSVFAGEFTYCSSTCSLLYGGLVDTPVQAPTVPIYPLEIKLDFDSSCNLKCPSCREHVIIEKNNRRIQAQNQVFNSIIEHAQKNPNQSITVAPINSGELFASHSGLQFLKNLQDSTIKNISLIINTNGTLIYRNRQLIQNLLPRIVKWYVSIDAVDSTVYQTVRGGDWEELIKGLDFLRQQQIKNLQFNFVVQKANYHQIEEFADWSQYYGAKVHFQPLADWGHWDQSWWEENQVPDQDILIALQNTANKYGNRVSVPNTVAQLFNQNTP